MPKAVAKKYRVQWSKEDEVADGDDRHFNRRAKEVVDQIRSGTLGLRIESHSLEIALPAPMKDPAKAMRWLDRLIELSQDLRGRRGPYR